jgi:hypothetical protein
MRCSADSYLKELKAEAERDRGQALGNSESWSAATGEATIVEA